MAVFFHGNRQRNNLDYFVVSSEQVASNKQIASRVQRRFTKLQRFKYRTTDGR